MRFFIHNVLDRIPQLVQRVGTYLVGKGVGTEAIKTTSLCLEEMLTNTIQYGYRDQRLHDIQVDLAFSDGELIIEILDDAEPFDPTRYVSAPDANLPVKERQIGGLGIHLVKNLTESIEYYRQGSQNRLTLRISDL